ncbi:MAG: type III-B CRISPR-associated protein Cas10/Cmr2 [Acidobacteria bacterium 13_1_20CM_3_53_8]|nr:MAG: type III-B CRISPR-associated protein Cas10/Cmr2 [Acidobacteria bacterium 13_1_20CM_3_53_8]
MKHLITIAVGPVQVFIASARRSRDLWFGSWLLSELSKAAANEIVVVHNDKERLIFPATDNPNALIPDSTFNVVNKILAVVDDPKATGDAVLKAMKKRLLDISKIPFDKIEKDDAGYSYFRKDIAEKQVEDMIEFFWAAYEWKNENEYAKARENAELLLNARKATRDFKSSTAWASNAPKSALDGQRESVIHEDAFEKLDAKKLRTIYRVRSGERLCGVGLLKRNGNRGDDSFFSTSHVAALPLIERLKTQEHRDLIEKYVDDLCIALRLDKESSDLGRVPFKAPYKPHNVFSRIVNGQKISYDGHILFAERLDDLIEGKNNKAKDDLDKAKDKLNKFLKAALNDEKPLPYYALLLADGDNMGKAIDSIKDINRHRELSKELSAFAKSVSDVVINNHNGSLVYAGGDDVLAFVPLHTVLQCARELANEFKGKLKGFALKDNGKDYQPTLSVGVVIAHHLEPLQDALTLVRKAEKTAKTVEGKEALAIILSKRSGVDKTIKGSWQKIDDYEPLDQRLLNFIRLHRAGEIPDGAAYELRDLFLRLNCEKHEPEYKKLQEAMRKEAVRILGRKKIKNKDILDALAKDIESEKASVEDLANELIVARIFANAFDQAFGKVAQA